MINVKTMVLIISLLVFTKGYSQKPVSDSKQMIDSAITLRVQALLKSSKSPSGSNKTVVYLINENDFPYKYSGTQTGIEFKAIDLLCPENKSTLKRGIHAWKIIPTLKSNKMSIDIIDFLITYKNKNYHYANGGGSETVFEYSCDTDGWVLVKSKSQGL